MTGLDRADENPSRVGQATKAKTNPADPGATQQKTKTYIFLPLAYPASDQENALTKPKTF